MRWLWWLLTPVALVAVMAGTVLDVLALGAEGARDRLWDFWIRWSERTL